MTEDSASECHGASDRRLALPKKRESRSVPRWVAVESSKGLRQEDGRGGSFGRRASVGLGRKHSESRPDHFFRLPGGHNIQPSVGRPTSRLMVAGFGVSSIDFYARLAKLIKAIRLWIVGQIKPEFGLGAAS